MPKVRVHNVTISLDGLMAGPNQRLDAPFGDGVGWGDELHSWFMSASQDAAAGKSGIDVDYFVRGDQNIGATIMGRNMFGPQRGPWEDESWQGWWGDNPPYHHDVFVHTHHLRPALEMKPAGPPSTSPTSRRRRSCDAPSRPRAARTSGSAAGRRSSGSICAPG